MSRLPVKFRIVQFIYENQELSNIEILEVLKKEYPLDRAINEKVIDDYLLSLKGVGIIEITKAVVSYDENLIIFYKITDYGVSIMKYIEKF